MPIDVSALLLPIPGDSPSGADLRYSAVLEKIKEARRQEENISQGVWKHEIKTANFPLALKLSTEVLTKQSKDLQVAGWLTESLAYLEGFRGLRQGLELVRGLLETFWDNVFPQIGDGDLDLRSMPLSWIGTQLGSAVRSAPILKGGYNWYNHRSSRSIPTEEQAQLDPEKLAARTEALAEGDVSPEDFAKAFDVTSLESLKTCYDEVAGLTNYLESLNELCKGKFEDQSPDFGPLQLTLEEVGGVVRILFKTKEATELPSDSIPQSPVSTEYFQPSAQLRESAQEAVSVTQVPWSKVDHPGEPGSVDEAIERILSSARFLRQQEPDSPVPYLITRAIRWGQFRGAHGAQEMATAPPSQLRIDLKKMAVEGAWDALRETTEDAAGLTYGRAWLDLQRYAVDACRNSGYVSPANAILSELRAFIAEFPDLPKSMLADDTPAANPETVQWLINETVVNTGAAVEASSPIEEWKCNAVEVSSRGTDNPITSAAPDSYELATEAARAGRIDEAIELLTLEIAREPSGRARFLRRIQLAQVCIAAGNDEIGRPVLRDLSQEIVSRSLEEWEAAEVISQPLALLYRCLNGDMKEEKEELHARICRLDPLRAFRLVK